MVEGGNVFQCVGVRPGMNSLGDMANGGVLIGLAHVDQSLQVCFSAAKAPMR